MIKDTIFSPFREYRYTLYREWAPGDKVVQFIGLNPSTADEVKNDQPELRQSKTFNDWLSASKFNRHEQERQNEQ